MERYDYLEAVKEDVKNYIEENGIKVTSENREELEEQLNDDLFCYDSVTGNGSGSYTFSRWRASKNLCHNWDLLAEACDVTIRCYLLNQAISEVLDELEEETE